MIDREALKDIKESMQSPTGQLYSAIYCKQHPTICLSGNHRVQAAKELKMPVHKYEMDIDERAAKAGLSHQVMEQLVIMEANRGNRRVSESERSFEFAKLASILEGEGNPKPEIARKVIELSRFSEPYVYRNMPEEYMNPNRSQAIREGLSKLSSLRNHTMMEMEMAPPYSKGFSPVKGSMTQKAYTKSAAKLLMWLKEAGLKDALGEVLFDRDGKNSRDIELTYSADICIESKKLIIEAEGEGSSSKNNTKRDTFFVSKGYRVAHVPNELIDSDWGPILAEIIAQLA